MKRTAIIILVMLMLGAFPIPKAEAAARESNLLTNGSFEFWARYGLERMDDLHKHGPVFDGKDPLLPVRWTWEMRKPARLARSSDSHGGEYALAISAPKGTRGSYLTLGKLEVVPGATYSFGVWAKGTGSVNVYLMGQAVEGWQQLGKATRAAVKGWKRIGGKVKIPGHIRLVLLRITMGSPIDVVLDDAHISAPMNASFNADDVLSKKYSRDDKTILFLDFEKGDNSVHLDEKTVVTAPGGGRFGRGLRLDKPGMATVELKLTEMPKEGTLECWLSPDAMPMMVRKSGGIIHSLLEVRSANQFLGMLQADTSLRLRWKWRIDNQRYGKKNSMTAVNAISLRRMRKGQWTHVAISWSPSAWRLYVDGVLSEMQTKAPLKWWAAPVQLVISSSHGHYCWNGVIDEIRISKVNRYGPFTPVGAKPMPLPVPKVIVVKKAPKEDKPKIDFAAERKKMLTKIPRTLTGRFESKPRGDGRYVYEVTTAKPLVGGKEIVLEDGKIVPKLTTARYRNDRHFMGDPYNIGIYWKLKKIKPGKYWVGVTCRSEGKNGEAPLGGMRGMTAYLNGRIIQLSTTSNPIQVKPGVWFVELQGATAEPLKAGDEIAVLTGNRQLARLTLHAKEPARGAHRVGTNFGGHWWRPVTALRLSAFTTFPPAEGKSVNDRLTWGRYEMTTESPQDLLRGADGRAIAYCYLSNPFPVPVKVDYECTVRGYYRQVAGSEKVQLTLAPHSRVLRKIPFSLTKDDPGYSVTATVKALSAPDLGWPPYDEVAFFPGYRHIVPWHNPFFYKDHKRLYFKQPMPVARQTLVLDGRWEKALTTSLEPPMPAPANLKFTGWTVPFRYYRMQIAHLTPRPHGVYLRRKFTMGADSAGKTCRLVIAHVTDEATAYINGIRVGNVRGAMTPLVADVTQAVRPGENEIVVVVRDLLAIMDKAYVNPKNPVPSTAYLDAPGLFGKKALAMSNVKLEISAPVAANNILVLPSVRKMTLGARFSVVNNRKTEGRVRVRAFVQDERREVLELGVKELTLGSGKDAKVSFEKKWAKPRLWSPDDPHLYVLAVEVFDAATGKRVDLARQRFGFRESWIDGAKIMFNGYPVKLKGLSTPNPLGSKNAFHLARGAKIPHYTDEMGLLNTHPIAAIFNSSSKHNVERDVFWETAHKNVLVAAGQLQNHPSILAWDLSNEWLCFLGYSGTDPLLGAKRLKSVDDVLVRQDPTRWTFYNGDEDLHGLHNTFSTHYMLEATHSHPVAGFGFNKHSVYFPDGAFWRPLERDFLPSEELTINIHRNIKFRHGEKVIMNTENLWKVGNYMPPGLTKYVGEEDVLSPAVDSGSGPVAWMWKQNLDGHRDMGISSISYYGGQTATARRGYMIQTFIMPNTAHHGFGGRKFTRDYSLLNDLFRPAKMALRWKFVGPDGVAVADGADERDMGSAGFQRGKLSFGLPVVGERTKYTLQLRLESDGEFVCGEDRDIEVWPEVAVPVGTLARKLSLFDPKGDTGKVLKKAGVSFETLRKLAAPSGNGADWTVIIGEGALDEKNAASVAGLAGFVESGGRIVILAQEVLPGGLPAKTILEAREWSSQPFVRLPIHPVLKDVTSWDLHFWAPDRVSGRGAYSKPEGGPVIPLVDSGTNTGLEWVQMMELYRGKGIYLLCQLPLVAKYDEEPMAREMLARVISYTGGKATYRKPQRRLKLIVTPNSPVEKRLSGLNVACEVVASNAKFDAHSVVLIEASASVKDVDRAEWKKALERGATFVVAGARMDDAKWLSALAGRKVRITVPRYRMWEGRGYRNGFDPLTAGLSQVDLYWKRYGKSERDWAQAEDPTFIIEQLQYFSVQAREARELVFPGVLLELAVGKGRLIIDQRRWTTSNEKLVRLADRNVSALALGLNVKVAPYVAPRALPKKIAYRPIDLTPFANRSLRDDVPGDGKGGWSDQGPTADLRSFPTGKRRFRGVPFTIGSGAKSIIVLASKKRPGFATMPREVTIPVGYQVEGFYFIHSSAYTGRQAGLYQIQYADGTTHEIQLVSGENIRDWVSSDLGEFPRERGTKSMVAWTGSCKMWPTISALRMLWVNPKPQVAVRAVRFANPAVSSVPILIGMTVVVQKDAKAAAAEMAKTAKLFAEAKKALDAGKTAQAQALLKKIVTLNDGYGPAHQALADIYERKGDEAKALKAYKGWVRAGAMTPLPYNRIGEILEKRKDYKGALKAYTKSLEVEWNQPPIINAKARMEKMAK